MRSGAVAMSRSRACSSSPRHHALSRNASVASFPVAWSSSSLPRAARSPVAAAAVSAPTPSGSGGVAAEQAERGRRPGGRAVGVLPLQYGEPPAQVGHLLLRPEPGLGDLPTGGGDDAERGQLLDEPLPGPGKLPGGPVEVGDEPGHDADVHAGEAAGHRRGDADVADEPWRGRLPAEAADLLGDRLRGRGERLLQPGAPSFERPGENGGAAADPRVRRHRPRGVVERVRVFLSQLDNSR